MKKSMILAPVLVLLLGLFVVGDGIWLIINFSIPTGVVAILAGLFVLLGAYGGFLRLYLLRKNRPPEEGERDPADETGDSGENN